MVGNPDVADDVLAAGRLIRKDRRQQIRRPHALDGRRHLLATGKAEDRQRTRGIPTPPRLEHRRIEQRLPQHLLGRVGSDIPEDRLERKAVLLAERDDDAVVGRRGLQLEVERPAEPLPKRKAPRAVDPRTKWSVDDELHPAPLVEKALGNDSARGRERAKRRRSRPHVQDGLLGASCVEAALTGEPRHRVLVVGDRLPHVRHFVRELDRASGRLAAPERNRGGRAVCVLHTHAARFDASNAPRIRAEQKHVARQALDGEVLVQGADDGTFGLGDHEVLRVVWNGAARGNRREPRPAASTDHAVHFVPMEISTAAPAAGRDPFGEHGDHGVEVPARKAAIGIGTADQRKQVVLAPRLAGRGGDDLLRKHIEGPVRELERIERP